MPADGADRDRSDANRAPGDRHRAQGPGSASSANSTGSSAAALNPLQPSRRARLPLSGGSSAAASAVRGARHVGRRRLRIDRRVFARSRWNVGGWLRSLHRYAADAFVVVSVAAPRPRMAARPLPRRSAATRGWTGVPLLLFAFVCGVGGFWLNWDQLGQFSAEATAEWLDALPFFASPLARNFVSVARRRRPAVLAVRLRPHRRAAADGVRPVVPHPAHRPRGSVPAAALALGTALVCWRWRCACRSRATRPPTSRVVPAPLALDWYLLFVHPLIDATSAGFVWALLAAALLMLLALPFLPQRARQRRRRRGSIPPTATAAAAASSIALTRRSRWCRIRTATAAGVASSRRSTPISARAAASASAPARRRRRFAAAPSSSPASTCRSGRSTRCAASSTPVSPRGAAGERSSSSAAARRSRRARSAAPTSSRSAWSASASCRRRSSSTRCAAARPAWS